MERLLKSTLVSLILALSSCAKSESKKLESIQGIPISIGKSFEGSTGYIATVIDINGRKVLGVKYYGGVLTSTSTLIAAKYEALIQSEINDGDNEPITLYGHFDNDVFQIWGLEANGNTIGKIKCH